MTEFKREQSISGNGGLKLKTVEGEREVEIEIEPSDSEGMLKFKAKWPNGEEYEAVVNMSKI